MWQLCNGDPTWLKWSPKCCVVHNVYKMLFTMYTKCCTQCVHGVKAEKGNAMFILQYIIYIYRRYNAMYIVHTYIYTGNAMRCTKFANGKDCALSLIDEWSSEWWIERIKCSIKKRLHFYITSCNLQVWRTEEGVFLEEQGSLQNWRGCKHKCL